MKTDFTSCAELGQILQQNSWFLTTAESCTGGGIAHAVTSISGSSLWFDRGFVTYSNAAKEEMLGVKHETLHLYGAVSEETAKEMAEGALRNSHATVSIAVTGIAGPTGGSIDKPVGLVWFSFSIKENKTCTVKKIFTGNRQNIRREAVHFALEKIIAILKQK